MRRAKSGSSQQNQHNTTSSSGLQLFPAQGMSLYIFKYFPPKLINRRKHCDKEFVH